MKKFFPYLALIIVNIIWGATFVVAKIALREFPIMSLLFLRFLLVSIFILPFFLTEKRKNKIKIEHLPKLFLIGFTLITLNLALSYEGLSYTTAINASILTLLLPAISVLGGWMILREKIYWVNLIGTSLGLIGALLIIGIPTMFIGFVPTGVTIGNVLIILSDIAFVAGSILSKQMLKIYSNLTVTTIAFFIGCVTFAIPAGAEYLQNPHWISQVSFLGIFALAFLVFLSAITAYFLYEWSLEKVSVFKANLFQYLESGVTALLAVPILGERISYSFLIGTILIILGVYWGTIGKPEPHHYRHKPSRI